ncbi:FAD binding domain-containing protein [bacterium]|nr:FAD binding domain-containing protein [bacterium]
MILINEYRTPSNLQEAFELLQSSENSAVVGGGAFLRFSSKKIDVAVDLSKAGLSFINETEESVEIGAMTTYREMETSETLKTLFEGVLVKTIRNIVGIQMRNLFTIGGTVYARYGFSNLITTLLVLDAEIELYKAGRVTIKEYLDNRSIKNDILVKVIIPKNGQKVSFNMMQKTATDFPILTTAVSNNNGKIVIAVGARPAVAQIALNASQFASSNQLTEDVAKQVGELVANELSFSADLRSSAEYRKMICSVLVKRGLLEVL